MGVMVNGPIASGPERLCHVCKARVSGWRVISPVTAINLAEPEPVHIGQSAGEFLRQAPMILMRMTDQERRRPASVERFRQQAGRALRRVERPTGIEDEAIAIRVLDFDADATDLPCAAMDRQTAGS